MNTEAKPGKSELAAALHEMLDGFREAGVALDTDVDHVAQHNPAPDLPSTENRRN